MEVLGNKVREEKIVEGMQAEEEEDIEDALLIAVLLLISGCKKRSKDINNIDSNDLH